MSELDYRQLCALANQLASEFLADIPEPLQHVIDRGCYRHVQIGGFWHICHDHRNGNARAYTRQPADGRWKGFLQYSRGRYPKCFDNDLLHRLLWDWLGQAPRRQRLAEMAEWLQWELCKAVVFRIKRHRGLRSLLRGIDRALMPDRRLRAALVKRCGIQGVEYRYQQALRDWWALRALHKENPNVAAYIAHVYHGIGEDRQIIARGGCRAVRAQLQHLGLSPLAWRLICRHGPALWAPAPRANIPGYRPVEELSLYAGLLDHCRQAELPPKALAALWFSFREQIAVDPAEQIQFNRLFRLAWAHWRVQVHQPAAERLAEIESVLQPAAVLIADQKLMVPKHASWASATRRIRKAWARHQAALDTRPWPVLPDVVQIGNIRFEPICSTLQAVETGIALRNCLVNVQGWGQMHATTVYRIVESGRLMAVIGLGEHHMGHTILGFANRCMDTRYARVCALFEGIMEYSQQYSDVQQDKLTSIAPKRLIECRLRRHAV